MRLPSTIKLSVLGSFYQDLNIDDVEFSGVSGIDSLDPKSLVFIFKDKNVRSIDDSKYAFCFIDKDSPVDCSSLSKVKRVPNARLLLKSILDGIDRHFFLSDFPEKLSISPIAVISDSAQIAEDVFVGPFCYIGDNVVIESGTVIKSGVCVEKNTHIQEKCIIDHNVTIYSDVKIGKNVRIGAGSCIGSPGFGFEKKENKSWEHVPHLSGVVIGDRTFIGANVCIDAGILKPTCVENDVVIDNLVQIAHHVHIGELSAIAGCAGIAGSARIGKHCLIGGGTCINGHIQIADGTVITGMSMVTAHITQPGVYSSGIPAQDNSRWRRNAASFSHLAQLRKDLNRIKKDLLQEK